jgi:hypothetical protein
VEFSKKTAIHRVQPGIKRNKMPADQFKRVIEKYIPPASVNQVVELFRSEPIQLKIQRARKSKFGDYRSPRGTHGHRISINADLNAYAFLITLIHEFAHYLVYLDHKHKVKPHGVQWKLAFMNVMNPFLNEKVFPQDVLKELTKHMKNPKASSCSDPRLFAVLKKYDNKDVLHLRDINTGEVFKLGKRVFQKGEKLRTRYKCLDLQKEKYYLVNEFAEINRIKVS